MRQDDFNVRLRTGSCSVRRTRGLHVSRKAGVRECLTLQELLASDMTRAVLRADALEMRCFEATLQAATKRVRARHSKTQPTQKADDACHRRTASSEQYKANESLDPAGVGRGRARRRIRRAFGRG